MSAEDALPDVIKYTSIVFGSFAILGCIIVGISMLLFERLRTFTFKIIGFMFILDIILAISTVTGPVGTKDMLNGNESISFRCAFQASCFQFGILSTLFITLCLGIHLYRITNPGYTIKDLNPKLTTIIYILISIPCPLALTLHINITNKIEVSNDLWCWVNDTTIKAGLLLFIPNLVVCIVLLFIWLYIRIYRLNQLKTLLKSNTLDNPILIDSLKKFICEINNSFLPYLFVPFLAYIPGIFNLIANQLNLDGSGHVISWYFLSSSLLGCLHFIVFMFPNNLVKSKWRMLCCKYNVFRKNSRILRESNKFYLELL